MTYLLLHGLIGLAILIALRGMASAPPRLRLWLSFFGMAVWLVPIPLYRPTLNPETVPSTLMISIRALNLSPAPDAATGYLTTAQKQALFLWLGLVMAGVGLVKWGIDRRKHRRWLNALSRTGKPYPIPKPLIRLGVTAPVQTMPGFGAMTCGIRHPQIWIGEKHLDQPECIPLVVHEWHHIRQNDNLLTASIHLLECLFWWNPLVLHLGRKSRFYMELGCDLNCLKTLDPIEYQRAIAQTLHQKILGPKQTMRLVLAAQGSPHTTIQRLKQLNRSYQMNKKQKWSLAILIVFSGMAMAFPKTTNLAYAAGVQNTDPARVGQNNVEPPVFTKKVSPVYPSRAKEEHIQGYVILEAIFRGDGTVTDIEVLRGLGKGQFGFEEAARDALRQWEFQPGQVNGAAADVRMTIKIDFVTGKEK